MAVIGKIKIGEKKPSQNGGERPSAIDHFKPFSDGRYEKLFRDAYGEKPKTIPVFFVSDDISQSCPHFFELRDSTGKRVANGDGVTFNVATKNQDNTVSDLVVSPQDIDKWMNDLERTSGGNWKEILVLRFIIPDIPILGVWEFRTGGDDSTIPNIVGTIDTVKAMAGRISGIPFDLSVKMVKSDKAGSSSKYPVVSLVCNISTESAELVAKLPTGTFKMLTNNSIKGLSGGGSNEVSNEVEILQKITTIDDFNLTDINSYTNAAVSIGAMPPSEHRDALVLALSDKAQRCGYSWNREKKAYTS
jgi:Recombination directionality factor-like